MNNGYLVDAARRHVNLIQRDLDAAVKGNRVRITEDGRTHGRRFKAGREFVIVCVQLDSRTEPTLWLALPEAPKATVHCAWLGEVEWLE